MPPVSPSPIKARLTRRSALGSAFAFAFARASRYGLVVGCDDAAGAGAEPAATCSPVLSFA